MVQGSFAVCLVRTSLMDESPNRPSRWKKAAGDSMGVHREVESAEGGGKPVR